MEGGGTAVGGVEGGGTAVGGGAKAKGSDWGREEGEMAGVER